ncbi:MAG TPA: hypothetical protein VGJ82_14215 [Thermoanaerobaculia bacterium]
MLGYRAIRKTCCSEELTPAQLQQLMLKAQSGDLASMKRLYLFFDEGEEPARAKYWLQRAADSGEPEAELLMYEQLSGSKVPKERTAAVEFLLSAARHGFPPAQEALREAYRDREDPQNAVLWLQRSAASGDRNAVLVLCDLALNYRDVRQCAKCIEMNRQALAGLGQQSELARSLLAQRDRLARSEKNGGSR